MKKIHGIYRVISVLLVIVICTGCSMPKVSMQNSFEDYYRSMEKDSSRMTGMASDLAVLSEADDAAFKMNSHDYADLLINDSENKVITSYQCFKKLYPASITKIMTALLTMEKGNMSDRITLKHDVNLLEDGAVISTLTKGDTVTVEAVFRTMLVKSANDCAVILAEYIAGTQERFAEMMNERAKELGATKTHFVNSNGLHDNNHYTTAYDLYLIFKECVKYDIFVETVSMKDYMLTYENSRGQDVNEYMQSTNYFLLNEYPVPDGVVMYGGKTGTTSVANSCLILMTENQKGERFFSVVLGAKTKQQLYMSMTQLLEKTTN